MQTSEQLAGVFVEFAGARLELSKLCGPTLITGTTGCGKTLGVVNPLAAHIASIDAENSDRKAAVVYFNCKGRGDASFLDALPATRSADVVRITPEEGLCLFPRWAWKSHAELAQAVAAFLPELGRLIHATEFEFGSHFVYWQNLRDEFLRFVSGVEAGEPHAGEPKWEGEARAGALVDVSHFRSVLERAHALLEDVIQRRNVRTVPSDTNIARALASRFGKERWAQALTMLRADFQRSLAIPEEHDTLRLRAELFSFLDTDPAPGSVKDITLSLWEDFATENPSIQREAIDGAVRYAEMLDGTWEGIAGEVRGLIDPFRNTGALFSGAVAFEDILDEGQIAVVDLPGAGSAGAHRAGLIAVLFSFMNTLLGRYRRLNRKGAAINQLRPVVLVLDEFHSLLTRGRDEGFELFLSRCREFGCMALLATQNLRLVASAMGNSDKFESLLGLFTTCFFGRNSDGLTNAYAAMCCGREENRGRAAAVDFGLGNRELAAWLVQAQAQEGALRFPAEVFAGLRTGEFVMRTPGAPPRRFDAFSLPR